MPVMLCRVMSCLFSGLAKCPMLLLVSYFRISTYIFKSSLFTCWCPVVLTRNDWNVYFMLTFCNKIITDLVRWNHCETSIFGLSYQYSNFCLQLLMNMSDMFSCLVECQSLYTCHFCLRFHFILHVPFRFYFYSYVQWGTLQIIEHVLW